MRWVCKWQYFHAIRKVKYVVCVSENDPLVQHWYTPRVWCVCVCVCVCVCGVCVCVRACVWLRYLFRAVHFVLSTDDFLCENWCSEFTSICIRTGEKLHFIIVCSLCNILHFLVYFLCFPYVVPCDLYPQNLMWLVLCSSIINRILFNFSQSNVVVHKPKCIKLRQKALHVTFIIWKQRMKLIVHHLCTPKLGCVMR